MAVTRYQARLLEYRLAGVIGALLAESTNFFVDSRGLSHSPQVSLHSDRRRAEQAEPAGWNSEVRPLPCHS